MLIFLSLKFPLTELSCRGYVLEGENNSRRKEMSIRGPEVTPVVKKLLDSGLKKNIKFFKLFLKVLKVLMPNDI